MIPRYHLNVFRTTTGRYINNNLNSSNMDVDQDYQRGLVWGETRKRNFIKSLIQGLCVAPIVLNKRFENSHNFKGNYDYAIVDGKQRISALRSFVSNEFSIPTSWLDDDMIQDNNKEEIFYSDLSKTGIRIFDNMGVPTCEVTLETYEDEVELFDLFNFGGVPQGESDI